MVNDPVQMCMIAYAFNLIGHYAKDATFLRAHDMRREGLLICSDKLKMY